MDVVRFRLLCLGTHAFASALLIGASAFLFARFGGYEWPLWYLHGSERIVGLLVVVDMCLGPLVTLIVSDIKKSRKALQRDWLIVAVVQLAAFFYGGWALWQGRPVALVASVDRLELVAASQYSETPSRLLKNKCAKSVDLRSVPSWRVCWAAARVPRDRELREKLLFSALSGGADLAELPEHYVDADQVMSEFRLVVRTKVEAEKLAPFLRDNLDLKSFGDPSSFGLIWVQGRARAAAIVVRNSDMSYLGTVFE